MQDERGTRMAAKTMRRIVLVAILLIALAAAACAALFVFSSGTALEGARTSALNAIIDTTGVKECIDTELRARASEVADEYGIPRQILDAAVDTLDVKDWQVVNTPEKAAAQEPHEFEVSDSKVEVTTYEDDPSLVTVKSDGQVSTFGQSITFQVPESAQTYTELLPYLAAADEAGLLEALAAA